MKTVIWMLLLLLLPVMAFAQLTGPGYIITGSTAYTVTLLAGEKHLVYILFPDGDGNWYVSETLPTRYLWVSGATEKDRNKNAWMSGDVDLFMQPDTMVTVDNTVKDSLAFWIKPLTYDPVDREYAHIGSDSTCIKFGAKNSYTSTSQAYLAAWTSGEEYHCLLTGELWPCPGFKLYLKRMANDTGDDSVTVNIWSYMSRQNR
jgi:hypothetical protein